MGKPFLTEDATFEEKVIAYLSEVHTKLELLMGNGRDGIVQEYDKRIKVLEEAHAQHRNINYIGRLETLEAEHNQSIGRRTIVTALISTGAAGLFTIAYELIKGAIHK